MPKEERGLSSLIPSIIFEDDQLMVLNKPPQWVVNDADTTKNLNTVQGWIQENCDFPISKSYDLRSGIVHRLDKDTSGILLVGKTESAFLNLQKQFKERVIEKTYVALVHGKVLEEEGDITVPVGRLPWNKRKFGIVPGGREAETKYKVLKRYEKPGEKYDHFTLLELYPKTGRTHQIRVHLKHLGHPIVSDKTYAGRKTWRHDTKWCSRIFLHAGKISLMHPETNKKINFEIKLPDDLDSALLSLA